MTDYTNYQGFLDPKQDKEILKDVRGAERTESLFHEVVQPESRKKYPPMYSLRNYDHKGYPSAYQIYMASTDESEAALKLVGHMKHWRKLCSLKWFMEGRVEAGFEGLLQWREDMAARDERLAKKAIMDQVADGSVPAARALADMAKGKKAPVKRKTEKTKSEADSNIEDFLKRHKETKK